jgi:F-type H+-transporting ATPase subunit delta
VRELVRGYAAAAIETAQDGGDRQRLAAELGALGTALVSYAELRQTLTDSAVTPAVRRAIVTDLLEGKAAPVTVSLAGFAAYYERATELAPTIAALVVLAEQESHPERDEAVEPSAGRAVARERIRGYAERVLEELAGHDDIDRVEDECFAIARLLDTQPELRRVLGDTNVPYSARAGVLADLLGAQVAPATLRLARYVLRAGRTRDLVGTYEWLVELAARERGRRVAEVRSAVALEPAESERLAAALGRLVNRTVEVRVIDDPSVVGGLLVSVGNLVIDGTVRLRFERLRDLLVQPS